MSALGGWLKFWFVLGNALAVLALVAFNLDNPLVAVVAGAVLLFAFFYFFAPDPADSRSR
ncbi:hypothetical protein [Halopelagius longus]|uniref:Uncharacterized protein n=1 Tax=Halopelagius longus TaxID=1236180 RepID=A0A1H1C0A3_9EURY|nr:hypothetical protein [Halopelagius longus]RDI71005.1 hypothetical protein DWB78_04275 [Halopelagius longus]SDQ57608.1 hypothetical protein SAMN05216278_2046 [Halopelagius longus]